MGPRSGTVVDARTSLALWLRAGRLQRGLSLEDVARVTKIQSRILERLEAGKPDGLPADVFVRGFVRSVARCVGLGEDEALRRYAACAIDGSAKSAGPSARAVVDAMADLAPMAARTTPRVLVDTGAPEGAIEVELPADEPTILEAAEIGVKDLPAEPTAVETFMLPETGTLVVTPLVEVTVDAPVTTEPPVEAAPLEGEATPVEAAPVEALVEVPGSKKKRSRRTSTTPGKGRGKRKAMAAGTPAEPTPVVVEPAPTLEGAAFEEISPITIEVANASMATAGSAEGASPEEAVISHADQPDSAALSTETTEIGFTDTASESSRMVAAAVDVADALPVGSSATWTPQMPAPTTTSAPWRRGARGTTPPAPNLVAVIDDADPESAERELEDRRTKEPRRTFLPPILLDREDRSARQGGLTLAVIILLIAATLTLSYLMRRPSSSGDGVTSIESTSALVV